jgi:hypothetical protein
MTNVPFYQLGHEAIQGTTHSSRLLQHGVAIRTLLNGPLDPFQLAANSTYSHQDFLVGIAANVSHTVDQYSKKCVVYRRMALR